jgi:hypothetical protein
VRPSSRTQTCRSHCTTCGAHFTGDEGFDLHRVGSYRVPADHFDARRCIDPTEDKRFAAVSGECRISDPDNPKAGVAIWNLARRRQGVAGAGGGPSPPEACGRGSQQRLIRG